MIIWVVFGVLLLAAIVMFYLAITDKGEWNVERLPIPLPRCRWDGPTLTKGDLLTRRYQEYYERYED